MLSSRFFGCLKKKHKKKLASQSPSVVETTTLDPVEEIINLITTDHGSPQKTTEAVNALLERYDNLEVHRVIMTFADNIDLNTTSRDKLEIMSTNLQVLIPAMRNAIPPDPMQEFAQNAISEVVSGNIVNAGLKLVEKLSNQMISEYQHEEFMRRRGKR